MATRQDTQRRRDDLRQSLLANCRNGTLVAGEPLPTLRVLAVQFNLSVPVVRQVVKELMDEGFLHTRSTAGTFVGPHRDMANSLFLLLTPYPAEHNPQYVAACRGFEERIAQLSGNSLILDWEQAREWQSQGRLPEFRGVFELGRGRDEQPRFAIPDIARVVFAEQSDEGIGGDTIRFDNFDGGRQAALHLLKGGHRKVAFLGLHGRNGELGKYVWSAQRQDGWKTALQEQGIDPAHLSFLPATPGDPELETQVQSALGPARELLANSTISAVISVNPMVTIALTRALHESGLPPERWPAIVSFDDSVTTNNLTVTVVRLPWEKLGREAADLLWQRGMSLGEPCARRLVPMLLIPRLSCRLPWSFPFVNLPAASPRLERAEPARAA